MNIAKTLILLLAITFTGCTTKPAINTDKVKDIYKIDYDYELDEDSFTPEDFNMIQKAIGIKFPKGSRGLNLLFEGEYMDSSFIAKVEIYEPAHKEFIKQLEKLPNNDGTITNPSIENLPWWKVSPKTLHLKRLYERSAVIGIWLCKEGKQWILYIEWMTV